jgi:hypothetical protein
MVYSSMYYIVFLVARKSEGRNKVSGFWYVTLMNLIRGGRGKNRTFGSMVDAEFYLLPEPRRLNWGR